MKIVSSFFITCSIIYVISMVLSAILYLLHLDMLINSDLWEHLAGGFATFFLIPVIYFFVFIPIYILNKNIFNENEILFTYQRYLFIVIIPFIIILLFTVNNDRILHFVSVRIFLLQLFTSSLIGFYIFIKTIK
jgi:hypothetical protein